MGLDEALKYIANPVPYDVGRYHEAGMTAVSNRDQLKHRIFYKIPDPGSMTTNTSAQWDEIKAASTGERCTCGNCRTIWPKVWQDFVQKETVTIRDGETIYIVPEGGNYKDTMLRLDVVSQEGKLFLAPLLDPFSDAFDFSTLFGSKGYSLEQLGEALAKQSKPAPFAKKFPDGADVHAKNMTLCTVNSATSSEVVIGIGDGYVISKDPEKDFPT